MPCLSALKRELALPATVFGPRLLLPFKRLVSAALSRGSALVDLLRLVVRERRLRRRFGLRVALAAS